MFLRSPSQVQRTLESKVKSKQPFSAQLCKSQERIALPELRSNTLIKPKPDSANNSPGNCQEKKFSSLCVKLAESNNITENGKKRGIIELTVRAP